MPELPTTETQTEIAPLLFRAAAPRPRYGVHLLLLLLTLATSTMVGARLNYNFIHDLPIFGSGVGPSADAFPLRWVMRNPRELAHGLPFSFALLAFFLAHEMGHYLYCRKHRVDATLPFFLPFPTLIGMVGAVIKIRAPFRSRKVLFDIGVAGPLAGMCVALPLVMAGLVLSKPMLPSAFDPDTIFGTPLAVSLLRWLLPASHLPHLLAYIQPHPILLAGWVGIFATALNLIPGGQLDGGHILYAVRPAIHRVISPLIAVSLILLGAFAWSGWLLWGAILFLPFFRHPHVPEQPALSPAQTWVAVLALLLFVLTFNPAPFQHQSGIDILHSLRH